MPPILAVTVPFFAIVLAGYLAARRHVLPESAIPGLNAFVLYIALPCMLFRFGNGMPVRELLNPVAAAVWLVGAMLIVLVTIAFSLNARVGLKDAAFGALVAAFPNTGFLGLPLMTALLGPAATAPMLTTLLVDVFVTSSLCIALAEAAHAARDRGQGWRAAAARALRGAVSNPLPWAIALGALSSALGWRLAGPVEVVVRLLGDAATPVALFTIGAVLHRAQQHVHGQAHGQAPGQSRGRTAIADYVPVALVKLVLHPLLVFALALAARALGAPMSGSAVMVLTLAAALPSASNVSLLAERFGADNGRIALIIMTSTVLAFVSFSTLAWVFGVPPR